MSHITVTVDEAIKAYGNSLACEAFEPANRLLMQILAHPDWHFRSFFDLAACIFWAGRIYGIRQERQRRKASKG